MSSDSLTYISLLAYLFIDILELLGLSWAAEKGKVKVNRP